MKKVILFLPVILFTMSFTKETKTTIYKPILENINAFEKEFDQISEERKQQLKELTAFVEGKIKNKQKVELTFICTHNSRRSHISQIWAQTAAAYYDVPNVVAYSGGTEATALNPRAIKAMEEAGFKIAKTKEGTNPVYEVRFSDSENPIMAFSKKYSDPFNPLKDFAAILTCSHADENCPMVFGASTRISINYDDPKDFDGTPLEAAKYKERVHEIGREIAYAFSQVEK
jgi:arsenate reductase